MTTRFTDTIKLGMDPTVARAMWLEAMRSGAYEQGSRRLVYNYSEDGGGEFCCLGVLCDMLEGVRVNAGEFVCDLIQSDGDLNQGDGWKSGRWHSDAMPHGELCKRVGIELRDGDGNYLPGELAELNDDGESFENIADWLEKKMLSFSLTPGGNPFSEENEGERNHPENGGAA